MALHWPNTQVLVTGGTGFLGYHLTKQLCSLGARVRIFALPAPESHPVRQFPIESQWGDVRDAIAVRKAAKDCGVVFHTAGTVAVWGPALQAMHEIHVEGTRNVLAAVGKQARVVHTSSIVAVGATPGGDVLDETSPFTLCDLEIDYVRAKRGAEIVALDAATGGQDVVVVNPGYLIGPEDFEPSVMGDFSMRAWKGRMTIAAPGGYSLADVRDVADGHIRAAEFGQAGRRYILGGENMKMREFMRALSTAANYRPRAIPVLPLPLVWTAATVGEAWATITGRIPFPSFQHVRLNRYSWFVSSERAKAELGYNPRSVAESLRDSFAWFTSQKRRPLRGLTRWWMRAA